MASAETNASNAAGSRCSSGENQGFFLNGRSTTSVIVVVLLLRGLRAETQLFLLLYLRVLSPLHCYVWLPR